MPITGNQRMPSFSSNDPEDFLGGAAAVRAVGDTGELVWLAIGKRADGEPPA
jgi:hypothetical protein